jgi:AraC-like DNA-binding protein
VSNFEFFSYEPCTDLAPFVDAVWGVRGHGGHTTEAVLPNGAVELMINFGPVQRLVGHGDRQLDDSYRRAWLAGIQDRRLVHASDNGADHIAVRFRPGGAHAFFHLPMTDMTNRVFELDTLIGAEATSLRDRLGVIDGDRARALELQTWLLERRHVHDAFDTVQAAVELLRDGGAYRTSVADACAHLGLSNKHLVHQFRRIIGLPPKVFSRIERFQGVIGACRGRSRVDWVDLTHAFGYADQSHLIREFRRLGNVTPSDFLRRRTPDESHVVLG